MLVPHNKHSIASLKIPYWSLYILAAVAIIIAASVAYFTYTYYDLLTKKGEVRELRVANEDHTSKIQQLEDEIALLNIETKEMQDKLMAVEELEIAIREMVGLEVVETESRLERTDNLTASRGGGPEEIRDNLQNIEQEIQLTTSDLNQLKEDVQSRLEYLEAVPSRWPVTGGRVSSSFGYRNSPFGGGREFHNGIDIAARTGTPVKAAGSGRVVFSGWRSGYGNTIIIDHGYGLRSLYAHNSSLLVSSGSRVEAGETIARVGSTGRSTGPHLHFTVKKDGTPVNPMNYLN